MDEPCGRGTTGSGTGGGLVSQPRHALVQGQHMGPGPKEGMWRVPKGSSMDTEMGLTLRWKRRAGWL